MFNLIVGALLSIASTAVIAASGLTIKWARNKNKEHNNLVDHWGDHLEEASDLKKSVEELAKAIEDLKDTNESQSLALREIMGDILDEEHKRLVMQGYASPSEKEKFEKQYSAYHSNGGNGTRTAHYKDVMQMKSYKV